MSELNIVLLAINCFVLGIFVGAALWRVFVWLWRTFEYAP